MACAEDGHVGEKSGSKVGKQKAKLLFADSERNADILYATGVFVPDPFVFFQSRRKKYILINAMEYPRVKKQSPVDKVYCIPEVLAKHGIAGKGQPPNVCDACQALFHQKKIGRLEVPQSFPLGFADDLRARGFEVTTVPDPFFPSRVRKSDREIDLIRRVLRSTEYAMKVAADVLREARVGGKKGNDLFLGSERLTSERLRFLIHRALLEKQCTAQHTIVAGGRQGYDPHQVGTGPLRAGQPIIVDIFPRSDVTGYHGDMTRTFVKGRATERVRRMYSAVRAAQDYAFANLGPAVQAHVVNQGVKQVFRDQGFPEERKGGANVGFIHNTGHGLGLDVHEQPSISDRPCRLAPGHVLTVELGLYYPDVGGVRIEDVVCITEEGITKLTRMERRLEIP